MNGLKKAIKMYILWKQNVNFMEHVQGTESNTYDIEYLISSSFRMDVAKKNYWNGNHQFQRN